MVRKKRRSSKLSQEQQGIINGYKSGLEKTIAKQIEDVTGFPAAYETEVIEYIDPMIHKYRPDFSLPNGIKVETKGYFLPKDRRKHLLVKQQHPELDIRFVFSNSKTKLSKASKTTYGSWCEKHGFIYADKEIPKEWFKEKKKKGK